MKNKSVSDFVAAHMDATLKSSEHKALHGVQYKYASDETASVDMNDAKDKKECKVCEKMMDACTCDEDESKADDNLSVSAFDVAIDSLLTASAALDAVGMANSSTLSLKIASIVVEAKKKDKEEKMSPKDRMAAMRKAKDDKNAADDKAKVKAKAEKEKAAEKAKAEKEKAKAKAEKEKAAAKAKADKEKAAKAKKV